MAKEPDNLVLQLLREMRATLDGHTTEFKKLNRQIDDWAQTSAQAAGFSVHANTKIDSLEAQMAKRFDRFEKRLKKLEQQA